MSLDTVVEDIRDEARSRAEELREEADAEAEGIIAEAEADAEGIIDEAEREAQRRIEQERERERSSAALEAKQARLEARRDVLESVRADVEDRIAELEGERREALTAALFDAAIAEFDEGEAVVVRGRDSDAALLESLIADRDDAVVGDPYGCLGGVVVEGESSRLRVNNTFDSVLETIWDEELRALADRLFEQ